MKYQGGNREHYVSDLKAHLDMLTEFHLIGQHDQSSHGGGGSGPSGGGGTGAFKIDKKDIKHSDEVDPAALKTERNRKIKKAAIIIAAVIVAAGVIYVGKKKYDENAPIRDYKKQVNKETKEYIRNSEEEGAYKRIQKAVDEAHGPPLKVHTLQGKSGKSYTLKDHSGKLSDEKAQSYINDLDAIHSKKKINNDIVPEISVHSRSPLSPDARAFVIHSPKQRTIHINEDSMNEIGGKADTEYKDGIKKKYKKGLMMPSNDTDPQKATVFHEYGHLVDANDRTITKGRKRVSFLKSFFSSPTDPKRGMSVYGSTKPVEAFAESFSEFHMTDGTTDNKAAQDYAKEYGWGDAA